MKRYTTFFLAFFAAMILLNGCVSYTDLPAGTVLDVRPAKTSAVVEKETINVPSLPAEKAPPKEYRIGPADVLYINVGGKPELSSPMVSSGNQVQGSRVDGDGNIQLPMVGSVHVAGLTIDQIQRKLSGIFKRYLSNPWVVVEIAKYGSKPLFLLGQFRNAGTFYMDRPLTLLEGISLGGGLLDTANLRSARLLRDKKTVPVDIYKLLSEGVTTQNIWLQPGDSIYVPDDKNQNVFVLGAVKKAGPVPMPNGQLSLSQALASAQIDGVTDKEDQIRIIRSYSPTHGALLVVNFESILRGKALPFALQEGDIVYVPRSAIGNWNQALSQIVPSLQAFTASIQPFVQLKYLTNK